eukprot:Em0014g560a
MHSVWPLLRLYTRLQGVFMKPFRLLEDTCHQFDLQLAYTYQEESSSSSSFTKYAEELHKLQVATRLNWLKPKTPRQLLRTCSGGMWGGQPCYEYPYQACPGEEAVCGENGKD